MSLFLFLEDFFKSSRSRPVSCITMMQDSRGCWQSLPASVRLRIANLSRGDESIPSTQPSRLLGKTASKRAPYSCEHQGSLLIPQQSRNQASAATPANSETLSSASPPISVERQPQVAESEVLVTTSQALASRNSFEEIAELSDAQRSNNNCAYVAEEISTSAAEADNASTLQFYNSVCLVEHTVDEQTVKDAREEATALLAAQGCNALDGGSIAGISHSSRGRGDTAVFLKRETQAQAGNTALLTVMDALLSFQPRLAAAGYNVTGPASFQLACHPAGTGFYTRHSDRSPSCPARELTAICYLNPSWTVQDAGELRICNGGREGISTIAPKGGRAVLFDSGLEHEVLPAYADRYAVTCWFSRAKPSDLEVPAGCAADSILTPQLGPEQQMPPWQSYSEQASSSARHSNQTALPQSGSSVELAFEHLSTNMDVKAAGDRPFSGRNPELKDRVGGSSAAAGKAIDANTIAGKGDQICHTESHTRSGRTVKRAEANLSLPGSTSDSESAERGADSDAIKQGSCSTSSSGLQLIQSLLQPSPALSSRDQHLSAAASDVGRRQYDLVEQLGSKAQHVGRFAATVSEGKADPQSAFLKWSPIDAAAVERSIPQNRANRSLLQSLRASPAPPPASRTCARSQDSKARPHSLQRLLSENCNLDKDTIASANGGDEQSLENQQCQRQHSSDKQLADQQPSGGRLHHLPPKASRPCEPSREQASPRSNLVGSREDMIFVSVAAYRDPEAQWTLQDLFVKAARPERLRVGVVWQIDAAADTDFVRLAGSQAWLKQVREVRLDWREATGPCKARSLAQALWEGEEYFLQIDSHMRFGDGWDDKLVRWLHQAEESSELGKAVLSSYPPAYQGKGPAASLPSNLRGTLLCADRFDQDGMLRVKGRRLASTPAAPVRSLFWAAGFSFSRKDLLQQVPYDRNLPFLFFGEELSMLARMWTCGFDVWAPPSTVVCHLWTRTYRHTLQKDLEPDLVAKGRSQAHVRRLLGMTGCSTKQCTPEHSGSWAPTTPESSPPYETPKRHPTGHPTTVPGEADALSAKTTGSACGLGQVRSLQAFWAHVGVDFCLREISVMARRGGQAAEEAFA